MAICHRVLPSLCGGLLLAGTLMQPGAGAETASLSLGATADTYVSSASPSTAFGTATTMRVDSSPNEAAYLRFEVSGVDGRHVIGARLRLLQKNSSPLGGRVHSISSTSWSESTTYATRPEVDGPLLGSFGAVSEQAYYDVDVTAAIVGDGAVSFAILPASTDSSVWMSREAKNGKPQLIFDLAANDSIGDGISEVAQAANGSSDPTYFSSNHRLAMTAAGRLVAVHGRHGQGVQLAWRDPSGGWLTVTSGARLDGLLLSDSKTGDWPSSIVVGRDAGGAEHAWVVWAGSSFSTPRPLQLRRLSDLDARGGPTVGPLVTLEAPALGAARPDIQLETAPDGTVRAAVAWIRRAQDSAYELVTAWIEDLSTDTPGLSSETVHFSTTSSSRGATLASTPQGMRAIIRSASGRLVQLAHDSAAPLSKWTTGANGPIITNYPAAATLADGSVVTSAEADSANGIVAVQRVSPGGTLSAVELTLRGYVQPTVATDGARVWLLAVRTADRFVVSRTYDPSTGWSSEDQVEVGSEAGGHAGYPNAVRQTDGRLRFLVRGASGGTVQAAVLASQRTTD